MTDELTYSDALITLAKGHMKLGKCLYRTSCHTAKDIAKGVLHHPLVFIVLLVSYVGMFVMMANARAERDNLTHQIYKCEQSNDSLKLLTKKLY